MEIKFKRDTSFRKQFFVPDSFAHPAKMDAQLLIWIVENYTKKWETILDPMAGSGTLMLACGLSRNVVLVELEEKFCKMMRDNWAKVRMWPQLGHRMGTCDIIQGDARQLEGLLVDKIVTSPPYAGAEQFLDKEWINREQPRPHRPQVDKCIFSPPYTEANQRQDLEFLRKIAEDQSAKYRSGENKGHFASAEAISRYYEKQSIESSPDNISNLPYGNIGAVISSPPYENTIAEGDEGPLSHAVHDPNYKPKRKGYTERVDAVVTSPPYEGSLQADSDSGKARVKRLRGSGHNGIADRIEKAHNWHQHEADYNPENPTNIGNLKSQSYLEAMLQVYAQCWSVLKDGGLLILVTKNFIRNKQVIRLDTDTIKLCEQAGFTYLERHYRKLPSQSFWRVIYHKKHPEVEQINYEDVLVFQKLELKV